MLKPDFPTLRNFLTRKIRFLEFDQLVFDGKAPEQILTVENVAKSEAKKWKSCQRFEGRIPLYLVDTVFSLRRQYLSMVQRVLRPFYLLYPKISLDQLASCLPNEFYHKITPRKNEGDETHPLSNLSRWTTVCEIAKILGQNYGTDITALRKWAEEVDLKKINRDPLNVKGVGIAGLQYLRMHSGIDTVKPEIRLKHTLREWGYTWKHDYELIKLCEHLSKEVGFSPMEFGFICWFGREPNLENS